MIKPFKVEEYKEINKTELKLITSNIIEYICTKYSLTVNTVHYGDRFLCQYKPTSRYDGTTYEINIDQKIDVNTDINTLKFDEYVTFMNIENFINTYNVHAKYINLALYVFCLLHELGHVYDNVCRFNKVPEDIGKPFAMEEAIKAIVYLTFPVEEDDDDIFNYTLNPCEQRATIFAFQHFYETWQMLQYNGLIQL